VADGVLTPRSTARDTTDDAVLADRDADGVLTLTFNRPDRRNGWAEDLEQAYYARLTEAADDGAVRAVVITGAGSTFCPGADLSRLGGLGAEGARLPHNPVDVPRRFPKPLIAAINGACAGVGLVQALFCHVRFAADTARFSTAFARRGLVAEYGIAWTLTRLVGTENALDLLLSARTFDAPEAKELGLVSRVVPRADVLAAAQAYAGDLARNCSPRAMAVIAGQVLADQESTYDEALARAYDHVDRFIGSAELREGVASYLEKRPPRFAPLGRLPDPQAP
jgi:enoyl-CoA hydratase/carnithine racemase